MSPSLFCAKLLSKLLTNIYENSNAKSTVSSMSALHMRTRYENNQFHVFVTASSLLFTVYKNFSDLVYLHLKGNQMIQSLQHLQNYHYNHAQPLYL